MTKAKKNLVVPFWKLELPCWALGVEKKYARYAFPVDQTTQGQFRYNYVPDTISSEAQK